MNRLIRLERPDINPAHLEPDACHRAYLAKSPPEEFVKGDLALRPDPDEATRQLNAAIKPRPVISLVSAGAMHLVGTLLLLVGVLSGVRERSQLGLGATLAGLAVLIWLCVIPFAYFSQWGNKRAAKIALLSAVAMLSINLLCAFALR